MTRGAATLLAACAVCAVTAAVAETASIPADRPAISAQRPERRPVEATAPVEPPQSKPAEAPASPPPEPPATAAPQAGPTPATAKPDPADAETRAEPGADQSSSAAVATPDAPDAPEAAAPQPAPERIVESDFDFAACRLELRRLGASYTAEPEVNDATNPGCGIARPLKVTQILPGVMLEGGALMRCDTARALAHWLDEIVLPSTTRLPGAPQLASLALGTTYDCRGVVGNGPSKNLSEHALGSAIDIASFEFADGNRIEIQPPGDRGDLSVAFQNAVQGAACLYFTTVLGPGSNAAHDNHLHLDVKARRGGFRLCQ